MKKWNILSFAGLLVLLAVAGCQPKLAESPYGAREKHWEDVIKTNYPDWEPPQTVPPERLKPATAPADSGAPQIVAEEDQGTVIVEAPAALEQSEPVQTPVVADTPPAEEFQTYVVLKGDTLWKISRKFYGSGKHWKKIFEANRDIISNPDKVRAGTELKIPAVQ